MLKADWGKTPLGRVAPILLVIIASVAANAKDNPKPVFLRAECEGKVSTALLASLKEEIDISQKYQLVAHLDDNGRLDVVLAIYMNCVEHNDIAAIATAYGQAKCLSTTNCHQLVDGSSVRSALCDVNATAECGRALFKAFDEYMSSRKPPLRPN